MINLRYRMIYFYMAWLFIACSDSKHDDAISYNQDIITDGSFVKIDTLYPDIILNNSNLQMGHPTALKFNQNNGNVYVLDSQDNDIKILSEEFKYLKTFGRFGQGPCEFSRPYDIVFSQLGNIYTYESQNMRIQIFDEHLNYLSMIPVNLLLPFNSFDVDSLGYIYYPNRETDNNSLISKVDVNGRLMEEFGEKLSYAHFPRHIWQNINYIFIRSNKNNLYCCFNHEPIIRKYNQQRQLLYELNLSELKDAKMYRDYLQRQNLAHLIPTYFSYIDVDDKNLIVSLETNFAPDIHGTNNTFYIFDKNTGRPVTKKIIIVSDDSEMAHIPDFDASHLKYYFFVEQVSGNLARVPKNKPTNRRVK